jgi:hypothetical protein
MPTSPSRKAATLAELARGQGNPPNPEEVTPRGIVERQA